MGWPVGELRAAGLSVAQLQALLQGKFPARTGNQLGNLVSVQLVRNNGPKYTLVGAVVNPGPYPLLRETTVLDALAASGGFRAHAATATIYVMRAAAVVHSSERFEFNYNDVVEGRHLEQNITLRDGDIVSVPGD
jgi:polysaccharide export outer membrane protein